MPKNKKYRYLLFDVDDTLFDFEKAEKFAFEHTMSEFGIEPTDELTDRYSKINGSLWLALQNGEISQSFLVTERFRMLDIGCDPVAVNERYITHMGSQAILFDDTYEVCERLSELYELYMITNSVPFVHRSRIKNCPITPFFKESFISGEIGHVKPSSGFFDAVSDRIKDFQKEYALVIGDSPSSDLAGALNYGIDCAYINRRGRALPDDMAPEYTFSDLRGLYEILL